MTAKIYVPAPGKTTPMPHGQPDWPEDGRPIDQTSSYETRLVRDGDLVLKQPSAPKKKEA